MSCLLAGRLRGVVVGYSGMDKSLSGVGVLGCLATLGRGFVFSLASAVWLRGVAGLVCLFCCWHPRFVFVRHALPLCGAAPTFLCRRKEK
jgi:hypothetical protein